MLNILYTVIIYPITQIIEFVFVFSQKVFKETGLSVAAVSLAISFLTLPLYVVAEKWQQTERDIQKRLKPKIDSIKAVFTGDEQYMILSAYYRQNRYHPVYALRGSVGLLIQIPFFIAAYSYLSNLDALAGASFLGIRDLGSPDTLLAIGGGIHVLPLAMTAINIVAGAIYLKGFSLRDKIQVYGMALVFLLLLYKAPSGLVLYWTLNNVFSFFKNCYYRIAFRYKNKCVFGCLSALCAAMVYYILAVHNGSPQQRILIALTAATIGLAPWALPLLKKFPLGLSGFVGTDRRLFTVFIGSFTLLWVLTGWYIPSTLVASSPQEFAYIDNYTTPLYFIGNTLLQSFGVFIFWSCCIYIFFSKKVKIALALLGLICGVCALCNAFIYPGNYGLISITMQFAQSVSHSSTEILQNALVLLAVSLVIALLFFRGIPKALLPLPGLCAAVLLILSGVNIATIHKSFREVREFHQAENTDITAIEPLFSLSKTGRNVVLLMLDRASSSFFPYIIEESPDLNGAYSGFVYYPNTVSFNGYTRIGAPPIFGGYEYIPEEINRRNTVSLADKHNEALLLLPRIFSESGWDVTVTDPPYPNYSQQQDLRIYDLYPRVKAYITDSVYTDFWLAEHDIKLPSTSDILKRDIFWYSLFRASPAAVRRGLYQYGDWCSPVSGQKISSFLNGYSVLDYLPQLTGISGEKENTALIMVNNTTHEGALLQQPDYRPALYISGYGPSPFSKETEYHINIAAFKRLADWFGFLKAEGVYDNTRIIIVSDHGSQISYVTKPKPGMPDNFDNLHPMLLVKDFGASGPLKTDMAFMTNADVPCMALADLFERPINPFTQKEITAALKQNELYIAVSGEVHLGNSGETRFRLNSKDDYYVRDNIFDAKNWRRAGE